MIFSLKQDNFQGFWENLKSETVISVTYGTEFVFFSGFYCVLFCMPVCTLFIFIVIFYLLTDAIGFFHKRFNFLPDFRSVA